MTAAASRVVRVWSGGPLQGTVAVPGDKSISHRGLIIGALAEGRSVVRGLSDGEDVARTRVSLGSLGVAMEQRGPGEWAVTGGRDRLRPADRPLECGNSGTTMRLLLGVLAGLPGSSTVVGDDSLSRRPMDRVAVPLCQMGARVEGVGPECLPPVRIEGGALRGIRWRPPMASAQVKSSVLLAGLDADGETVVHEPVPTRAHTEEMLAAAGADITVEEGERGRKVVVRRSRLHPVDLTVPGDPSQAAFWLVAGTLVPGSDVRVDAVYGGPARTGYLGVLDRMGARVDRTSRPEGIALRARHATLAATEVYAAEIPSLDEVPVLAVAAAHAEGTTTFHDVGELRVKESDRMAAVADLVTAFGAAAEVRGNNLRVRGTGPGGLTGCEIEVSGDHRIAMAAAIAALSATGPTTIAGFETVATSYPSFAEHLQALGGSIDGSPGEGGTEPHASGR